mmetsp:Transcript_69779/g.204239  ORF Transcript_69779/g.204239 Transcript_69779/m.204239 type:complete len:211 (+) Transcript_69779:303-935(+)
MLANLPKHHNFFRLTKCLRPAIGPSTGLTCMVSFLIMSLRASSAALSSCSTRFSKLDKLPRSFCSFWKLSRFAVYRSCRDWFIARPRSRTAAMWLWSEGHVVMQVAWQAALFGGIIVASPTQRSFAWSISSRSCTRGESYFSSKSAGLRSEMSSTASAAPLTSQGLGVSMWRLVVCFMELETVGRVSCKAAASRSARGLRLCRAEGLTFE